jgi:NADH-quinone oxidoreductase subunit A
MSAQYVPVLLAFGFAVLVAAGMIGMSALLGRGHLRQTRKTETFESGMPLLDVSRKRVSVRFFVVAMVFIIFDVELAFLFPWAVTLRELVAEGNRAVVWDGLAFLILLAIGYVYLWREGAFDWSRRGSQQ